MSITKKEKMLTTAMKNYMLAKSAKTTPVNPSELGWTASEILKHQYQPSEILFDYMDKIEDYYKDYSDNIADAFNNYQETTDTEIISIKERISTNENDIDSLGTRVTTNEENIKTNTANIATNKGDIDELETDLKVDESIISNNTNRIASLESKTISDYLDSTQLQAVNSGITSSKVATYDNNTATIANHESRISQNEKDIATINGNSSVTGSIDNKIKTAIDKLVDNAPETYDTFKEIAEYIASDETNSASMLSNIQKNAKAIETNASDIATNKSNIATNKTNIETNTSNIAKNASAIETNASNIEINKANIATNANDIATLSSSKQDKLIEGLGIAIDENNVISLDEVLIDGDTYKFGTLESEDGDTTTYGGNA